jgi:hypothetical protein
MQVCPYPGLLRRHQSTLHTIQRYYTPVVFRRLAVSIRQTVRPVKGIGLQPSWHMVRSPVNPETITGRTNIGDDGSILLLLLLRLGFENLE